MIKEHYYKSMGVFSIAHPFKEERKSERWGTYYHAGDDVWSKALKQQDIYNLVAGRIVDFGSHRDYGKYVLLRHDPSFAGGVKDKLYSLYCHLSEINKGILNSTFIDSGDIIGKMGNTGNCWTKDMFNKWRPVSEAEVKDPKTGRGVHTHLQFHLMAKVDEGTGISYLVPPIVNDILKKKICREITDFCFRQWGKFMLKPDVVMEYFFNLQGRKITW